MTPLEKLKYDVVVIGSGPGGYVSAIRCAQLGFKTATKVFEQFDSSFYFKFLLKLHNFLMIIVIPIQKYLTQGTEDNRSFLFALLMLSNMAITFTVVYFWISKFASNMCF